MSHPKSNLTQYDWACLMVHFQTNRLHLDEWIVTLVQLTIFFGGLYLVGQKLAGWEAGLASVVIIVGCGVFKHYTLKNAREELQKSIEHRDGLFYRED